MVYHCFYKNIFRSIRIKAVRYISLFFQKNVSRRNFLKQIYTEKAVKFCKQSEVPAFEMASLSSSSIINFLQLVGKLKVIFAASISALDKDKTVRLTFFSRI